MTTNTKKSKINKSINEIRQDLIKKEQKRIVKFLKQKQIDDDKLNIAMDIIKDVAFMTIKTIELKKEVDEYGMVEEYQNGANQFGRKKSASFDAYLNMTKQKSALIKQLTDLLPSGDVSKSDNSLDPFDEFVSVRSSKK